MKTFLEYLGGFGLSGDFVSVLDTLQNGVKKVSCVVGGDSSCRECRSLNPSGEKQIALDILADQILTDEIKKNSLIGLIASEEKPQEESLGRGEFAVCFDPLDGSSLVSVNFAVGSIFGIYKAGTFVGVKGDDQLASMIAVYGPKVTLILTVRHGVVEFILNDRGEFVLRRESLNIGEGKMFSPGNLRACAYRDDYLNLVNYWCREQYVLRYSGGMVPDVNQILLKGNGIFSYPGYIDAPDGKLRVLFECAPMALLAEEAGGAASDGRVRILEKEVENVHQRTPVFLGSKVEVDRCVAFLGGSK